jgi:succinate dehydrogenase assembly factor 2
MATSVPLALRTQSSHSLHNCRKRLLKRSSAAATTAATVSPSLLHNNTYNNTISISYSHSHSLLYFNTTYHHHHRLLTTVVRDSSNKNNMVINEWSSSIPKTSETRKKELLWKSKQRGILELDLLIGTYANEYMKDMNDREIDELEQILDIESPDLLQIVLRKQEIPQHLQNSVVMKELLIYTHEKAKSFAPSTGNQ